MIKSVNSSRPAVSFAVQVLSVGSFFLNFCSVISFGCTPILMRELGLSDTATGILEGTVEGFALLVRAVTGMLSDFFGKRKFFLMGGYVISACSRFFLAAASTIGMVSLARLTEKLGNGLQASPREAFISDVTPSSLLGRAYGLNKTFSMAGSFAGALLMLISCLYALKEIRVLLWITSFLSVLSILVLGLGVKEPATYKKPIKTFSWRTQKEGFIRDCKEFSKDFWKTLFIISLFKLGYFSGTFLMALLKHSDASFFGQSLHGNAGLSNSVFLVIQNSACAFFSYPLGWISDRIDRRKVVACGFIFMMASLLCLAFGKSSLTLYTGIVLYGLQMSMQGALMAFLATTMPHHLHGTGFGIFFLVSGASIIFSNQVLMRVLASYYNDDLKPAFLIISGFVLLALILLPYATKKKR